MICDAAGPLLASTEKCLLLFPRLLLWSGVRRAAAAAALRPVLLPLFSVLLMKHRCIALRSSRDAAVLINRGEEPEANTYMKRDAMGNAVLILVCLVDREATCCCRGDQGSSKVGPERGQTAQNSMPLWSQTFYIPFPILVHHTHRQHNSRADAAQDLHARCQLPDRGSGSRRGCRCCLVQLTHATSARGASGAGAAAGAT